MAQIQHCYLKNLNKINIIKLLIISLIISIIYLSYYVFVKKITDIEKIVYIPPNSSLKEISNIIKTETDIFNQFIPYSMSLILGYEKKLVFGEYQINNDTTLLNLLKKIRFGNNIKRKITIIEGYENYQFKDLIYSSKMQIDTLLFNQYDLIGETFFYNRDQKLSSFLKDVHNFTNNYLKNNNNLKQFTNKELLIISSLVEKEGKNNEDKRLISSVIFNRLENKMKLDIDATVIYSITKGKFKLNRPLTYKDLKIQSNYNTYKNKGLPPGPICIPGYNTLKIVLENNKSPYFYYFFNKNKNSHIFSKNYKEHTYKLNEYRQKK